MTHQQDMKKLKVKLKEAYDRGYKEGQALSQKLLDEYNNI